MLELDKKKEKTELDKAAIVIADVLLLGHCYCYCEVLCNSM